MPEKMLPFRLHMLNGFSEPFYVASGSTCDVYKVRKNGKDFALKVVDCGTDDAAYTRALQEVKVNQRTRELSNIVPFHQYEVQVFGGRSYVCFLLDYLTTLEQQFTSQPMSIEDVIHLGIDLCRALDNCWRLQIAHLDIQPKNVYRASNGQWKLSDFGSSLSVSELAGCRELRGTPSYMAPEVYTRQAYSQQSDIYALGVLLYSLINGGSLPFGREFDKPLAIQYRLAGAPLAGLSQAGSHISCAILNACDPNPLLRPESFIRFQELLNNTLLATEPSVLMRLINPWVDSARPGSRPADSKKRKGSLLGELFGRKKVPDPSPSDPGKTEPCQIFTPDISFPESKIEGSTVDPSSSVQGSYIFNSDSFAATCPIDGPETQLFQSEPFTATAPINAPAFQIFQSDSMAYSCAFPSAPPQIFESDSQAFTCPIASAEPQIFQSDVLAFTCPIDSPEPQIFQSDNLAFTCPIDSPEPQIFQSDNLSFTCPIVSPEPQAYTSPGYPTQPAAPAPGYYPEPCASAPGYSPQPYAPAPGYPPQAYTPAPGYPPQPYAPAPGYPGQSYPSGPVYPGYPGYYPPPAPRMDQVRFSAIAPKSVEPDSSFLSRIFMYQESFRQVVDEALAQAEEPSQESATGFHKVKDGCQVKIVLSSPDVEIEDNIDSQIWSGGYLTFDFYVNLPDNYSKKQVVLKATVYFDDVPATRLMLSVKVQSQQNAPISVTRQDILSAFVSYASQDRKRVASLIQGMTKARPDLDVFFDVSSLSSGQQWENRLYKEIDSRDILFLCWSQNARNSPWVEREWRYALQTKGVDCIEPIPLEPPDFCPPPQELRSKHFNDMLLYIIDR